MKAVKLIIALFLLVKLPVSSQDSTGIKKVSWELSYTKGISFGSPSLQFRSNEINYELQPAYHSPDVISFGANIFRYFGIGAVAGKINQDLVSVLRPCEFKTIFISPVFRFTYKNLVSLEAGPSVNYIHYYHEVSGPDAGTYVYDIGSFRTTGFLLKASAGFPDKSTIYFKVEAQYLNEGSIMPVISKSRPVYFKTLIYQDYLKLSSFYAGGGFGIRIFNSPRQPNVQKELRNESDKKILPEHFQLGLGIDLLYPAPLPSLRIAYGNNFQVEAIAGLFCGGGLYFHFLGKSQISGQKPVYMALKMLAAGKREIFLFPRFGYTLGNSEKFGLNIDIGPTFELDGSSNDLKVITTYPAIGATFFVRL